MLTANDDPRGALARGADRRLDPAQQVSLALGLAAVREGDDDVEPLAAQRAELVLGLGQAARGESRALGVERERLTLGQWVELAAALERGRRDPLLAPDGAHLVGAPDEVGRALERPDDLAAQPRRRLPVLERERHEVGTPLGRREDGRGLDLAEGALGVGREGADRLDLLAEEVDPQRLASRAREDVEQPSPDRELAALLDPLDPLVAGVGERVGEPVDSGGGAPHEP